MDKAVTIDTSAILQEKYKSYIYLRATPSDEKESLTAGISKNLETMRFPFCLYEQFLDICPASLIQLDLANMLSGLISF